MRFEYLESLDNQRHRGSGNGRCDPIDSVNRELSGSSPGEVPMIFITGRTDVSVTVQAMKAGALE